MTGSWNLSKNSCIIFDVDGVLIDIRRSYDLAVSGTVEALLSERGISYSLDPELIRDLRNKGEFPQDYELCQTLLAGCLLSGLDESRLRQFVAEFPEGGTFADVAQSVQTSSPLEQVKEIFDSLYLGQNGDGLWKQERSMADPGLLAQVSARYRTGIITGRSRREMDLAELILKFRFDSAVTADEYKKPDPDALRSIAGISAEGIYAGDTLNDAKLVENYNRKYSGRFRFAHIGEEFEDVSEFINSLEL